MKFRNSKEVVLTLFLFSTSVYAEGSGECKTFDSDVDSERIQALDDALNQELTSASKHKILQSAKYVADIRKLIGQVTNDCAKDAFEGLLKGGGHTGFPLVSYRYSTKVASTFARDALLAISSRETFFNWQDAVFKSAASIKSEKQLLLFKEMLSLVTIKDFRAAAYKILPNLTHEQIPLYKILISAKSSFNWKDEVFEALSKIPDRAKDHPNYKRDTFVKLVQSVHHFDWPASAYTNIEDIDSREKYEAYEYILERYPIVKTLTTHSVSQLFTPILMGSQLINILLQQIQQQHGVGLVAAWSLTQTGLYTFLKENHLSIAGLISYLKFMPELLNPLKVASGLKSILSRFGLSSSSVVPLNAIAAVGVAAIVPHAQAYFGAATNADVVFASAAQIKSHHGLVVFKSLIERVNMSDWPAGVYTEATAIKTEAQKRRFDLLLHSTGVLNQYNDAAFQVAVSDSLDLGPTISMPSGRKKILVSPGELAFTKLVESGKDFPEFTYGLLGELKSEEALKSLEKVIDSNESSKDNPILERAEAMGAIVSIQNASQRSAVEAVIEDHQTVWSNETYEKASKVNSEQDLGEFRKYLSMHRSQQGQVQKWPSDYIKIGLYVIAAAMFCSSQASSESKPEEAVVSVDQGPGSSPSDQNPSIVPNAEHTNREASLPIQESGQDPSHDKSETRPSSPRNIVLAPFTTLPEQASFTKDLERRGEQLLSIGVKDRMQKSGRGNVEYLQSLTYSNPNHSKKALILFQDYESDHNGAFNFPSLALLGALSVEHSIVFARVKNMEDVKHYLDNNRNIDFFELGGHGGKNSITLSTGHFFSGRDPEDKDLFSNMNPNATIFLEGCGNGSTYGSNLNLVDVVHKTAPILTVIGATEITDEDNIRVLSVRPLVFALRNRGSDMTYKVTKVDNEMWESAKRDKVPVVNKFYLSPSYSYAETKWKNYAAVRSPEELDKHLKFIKEHSKLYSGDVRQLVNSLKKIANGYRLYNPSNRSHLTAKEISIELLRDIREVAYADTLDMSHEEKETPDLSSPDRHVMVNIPAISNYLEITKSFDDLKRTNKGSREERIQAVHIETDLVTTHLNLPNLLKEVTQIHNSPVPENAEFHFKSLYLYAPSGKFFNNEQSKTIEDINELLSPQEVHIFKKQHQEFPFLH